MKQLLFFLLAFVLVACSGDGSQTFHGQAEGLDKQQTITFRAKEGNTLSAILTTPEPANLRINQIISPSGNADGPFGADMTYNINETGEWKLIIGGSLMQGDDYHGDFTLKIELK